MNATDFIISKLKSISSKISGIGIKYAYDRTTDFHIVEISPESIRLNDEEYLEMEYMLWKEFQNSFPEEDLLVTGVKKMNNMDNILFEKSLPVDYGKYSSFNSFFSIRFKLSRKENINTNQEYSYINESYNIAA